MNEKQPPRSPGSPKGAANESSNQSISQQKQAREGASPMEFGVGIGIEQRIPSQLLNDMANQIYSHVISALKQERMQAEYERKLDFERKFNLLIKELGESRVDIQKEISSSQRGIGDQITNLKSKVQEMENKLAVITTELRFIKYIGGGIFLTSLTVILRFFFFT